MNNECMKCGHYNPSEASVCENCGAELIEVLADDNVVIKNSAGENMEKGERFIFGLSLYVFFVFPFFLTLFYKDLGLSYNLYRNITFAILPCLGLFLLILGKVIYPKSKMFLRLLLGFIILIAFLCLIYFGFGVGKVVKL